MIVKTTLRCILRSPRYHLSTIQSVLAHSAQSEYCPPSKIRDPALKNLTVNKAEDIVEHVVASSAVRKELEGLGVVHGVPLLVDLYPVKYHVRRRRCIPGEMVS